MVQVFEIVILLFFIVRNDAQPCWSWLLAVKYVLFGCFDILVILVVDDHVSDLLFSQLVLLPPGDLACSSLTISKL